MENNNNKNNNFGSNILRSLAEGLLNDVLCRVVPILVKETSVCSPARSGAGTGKDGGAGVRFLDSAVCFFIVLLVSR